MPAWRSQRQPPPERRQRAESDAPSERKPAAALCERDVGRRAHLTPLVALRGRLRAFTLAHALDDSAKVFERSVSAGMRDRGPQRVGIVREAFLRCVRDRSAKAFPPPLAESSRELRRGSPKRLRREGGALLWFRSPERLALLFRSAESLALLENRCARIVGQRRHERRDRGGFERVEDAQRRDTQRLLPRGVEDHRRQPIDHGGASRSAHEHACDADGRHAGVRVDCRRRQRMERGIERPRIADGFERAPRRRACRRRLGAGFRNCDQALHRARADHRQPRDARLAFHRIGRAQVCDKRLNLFGRRDPDRHRGRS